MSRHFVVIMITVFLVSVASAAAQTPPRASTSQGANGKEVAANAGNGPSALSNDLLVDRRETLQGEIRVLTDQLGYLRDLRGYVSQLGIAKSQNNKPKQNELESRISELESWAGLQPDDKRDLTTIDTSVIDKQGDIDARRKQLRAVDFEISSRLNSSAEKKAAQDFKTYMSGGFGLIIAFVIVGFFWTASRSTRVTEEIFSGQAGLQFITLFSLVIAIILFGITGVLEGKELSALLGGLAGYILGRSGVGAASGGGSDSRDGGKTQTPTRQSEIKASRKEAAEESQKAA